MDTDTYLKEIHSLIVNSSPEDELELRFGKFEGKRFKSDCNIETFNRVNDFVKSFGKVIYDGHQKIIIYINNQRNSTYNKRGICNIISFEDAKQVGGFEYDIKRKKKTYDVNEFDLRFCISQEKKIKKSEDVLEEIDFYMLRKRTVYEYNDFKIFMSYYTLNDASEFRFNIEIEVNNTVKYNIFSSFIKEFLKAYNGCKVLVNNTYKANVIEKYNHIFSLKKFKNVLVQPEALKLNKIYKEKIYSVSLKLDGIRKMIIVYDNQILTFNEGNLAIIHSMENNENTNFYVFDSEYYNGVYHIFDTLCYDNKDIRNTFLKERISLYTLFFETNKLNFIAYKEHHFSKYKNLYNISMKLLNQSNDLGGNAKGFSVDGLIYTSSEEYCITPLKFKFNHTIDFYIVKREDNEDNEDNKSNKVELYCKGPEKYLLFSHPDYPDIGLSELDIFNKFMNKSIVECYFCKTTKKFKPIKQRFDKSHPNFITIALDNFEMTINPFKIQLFKDQTSYEIKELEIFLHFDTVRFFHYVKRTILNDVVNINAKWRIKNIIYFNQGNLQDIQKFIDFNFKDISVITNDTDNNDFIKKIEKIKSDIITKNFEIKLVKPENISNISTNTYVVFAFNQTKDQIELVSDILSPGSIIICIDIDWDYIKSDLPIYSGLKVEYKNGIACINNQQFRETSKNIKGYCIIQENSFNSYVDTWYNHCSNNFLSNQGILLSKIYKFTIYKKNK